MKALFITTQTNDTHNHVDAWDSFSLTPAKRVQFDYRTGLGTDNYILKAARRAGEIDVIFYIGANRGAGLPSFEAFRELRKIAPTINMVSDAADTPWHKVIQTYRDEECFDLHVGIDGEPQSPVDHVTLTPVDHRPFDAVSVPKDIRCGFSGNVSGKRAMVLGAVGSRCWLRLRGDDYRDHVAFLKRCRMILNVAYTGSGHLYHVKGRVTEAAYAGACLLEARDSPTRFWFPRNVYMHYGSMEELIDLIESAPADRIEKCAAAFAKLTREKYNAAAIYNGILEKAGLVGHSVAVPAA